jgi:hypothetical protein
MRLFKGSMIAALVVGGCLTSAQAATVSSESGGVLVRTTSGFEPISGAAAVTAGTQIMVSPGGVGRISYGSGCVVRLGPGRVWTVSERVPCEANQKVIDLTGNARMAAGNPERCKENDRREQCRRGGWLPESSGGPFTGPGAAVLGTVFLGTVIGAPIYAFTRPTSTRPASP